MSFHVVYTLICDGCGEPSQLEELTGTSNPDALRRAAKRIGQAAARDYCPACWAAREAHGPQEEVAA